MDDESIIGGSVRLSDGSPIGNLNVQCFKAFAIPCGEPIMRAPRHPW